MPDIDPVSIDQKIAACLTDAYFPDWIEAVKKVEVMDFDSLVPGHDSLGSKADVTEARQYLEALYGAVLNAARQGKSLHEMQQTILLEKFNHLGHYHEWRELNIEGMYRQISLHRRGN